MGYVQAEDTLSEIVSEFEQTEVVKETENDAKKEEMEGNETEKIETAATEEIVSTEVPNTEGTKEPESSDSGKQTEENSGESKETEKDSEKEEERATEQENTEGTKETEISSSETMTEGMTETGSEIEKEMETDSFGIEEKKETESPDTENVKEETKVENSKEIETDSKTDSDKKENLTLKNTKLDDKENNLLKQGFSIFIDTTYPAVNVSEATVEIYQYLREEMELNHAAACGVLANIHLESNFNPLAIGDGGTSLGLCQWHLGRCTNLMNYCSANGLDYCTIEGQMRYLQFELENSYTHVLNYLLEVEESGQGAYDAAAFWCLWYEIPSYASQRAIQRGNLAREEYYPESFTWNADVKKETKENKKLKRNSKAVTQSRLCVRETDDPNAEVLAVLDEQETVRVLWVQDDWCRISYRNGEKGYVSIEYLKDAEA